MKIHLWFPKNVHFFEGSLEDNIVLNPNFNYKKNFQKRINKEILVYCVLDELFKELKNSSISGETNKRGLSGGQTQRVGIARALHTNSDIIIFDEPTSALDNETSKQLMFNLKKLFEDKFILLITHDKELLQISDSVYELKNDKICIS